MLFEVIVQLCWHASLVQELILLSIRLLEQSTCICFYKKRACIWWNKFYLFFDKEGAIAFFSYQRLLGAYSAVIQKVSREQLLQVCGSYFDDNRQVIGKPPGLVGAEQPVCQAKKRLQAILRIENNFEGIYSSSQELKPITRNWTFLLHC